jgi:hypothetical protein
MDSAQGGEGLQDPLDVVVVGGAQMPQTVGGQVVEHVQRADRVPHHFVQVTERHRGRGRVQSVQQRTQAPVVLVREQGFQPAGDRHGRADVRQRGEQGATQFVGVVQQLGVLLHRQQAPARRPQQSCRLRPLDQQG